MKVHKQAFKTKMGHGSKKIAFAGRLSLAKLVIKRIRAHVVTNNREIRPRNAAIAFGRYATPLVHKDFAVQKGITILFLCA